MGDADVIIVRCYWEFKRRSFLLNSRVSLIGRVSDDSI
jgi:hypothetical protein